MDIHSRNSNLWLTQVVLQVDTSVSARRDRVESTLKLRLVHPDRDLCSDPMNEPASVIEVKMAHDDVLDVLDVVSDCANRCVQLLRFVVSVARENVGQDWAPDLQSGERLACC